MGKKIYNYVLKKDWDFLAKKLRGPLPSLDNPNLKEPQNDPDDVICEPEATGTAVYPTLFSLCTSMHQFILKHHQLELLLISRMKPNRLLISRPVVLDRIV